ncbi:hypothetical protein BDL97_01G027300 [Sphagnum fallax]|nr:hypothetical protein BDL97_01G027300 [Sphagnum fallax]
MQWDSVGWSFLGQTWTNLCWSLCLRYVEGLKVKEWRPLTELKVLQPAFASHGVGKLELWSKSRTRRPTSRGIFLQQLEFKCRMCI